MDTLLTEDAWDALHALALKHVHGGAAPTIHWNTLAQLVVHGFANRHAITEAGLGALAECRRLIVGVCMTQRTDGRRAAYEASWIGTATGVSWSARVSWDGDAPVEMGGNVPGRGLDNPESVRRLVERSIRDHAGAP